MEKPLLRLGDVGAMSLQAFEPSLPCRGASARYAPCNSWCQARSRNPPWTEAKTRADIYRSKYLPAMTPQSADKRSTVPWSCSEWNSSRKSLNNSVMNCEIMLLFSAVKCEQNVTKEPQDEAFESFQILVDGVLHLSKVQISHIRMNHLPFPKTSAIAASFIACGFLFSASAKAQTPGDTVYFDPSHAGNTTTGGAGDFSTSDFLRSDHEYRCAICLWLNACYRHPLRSNPSH